MNKRSCFSKQKSAQLRDRLACHLAKVFSDGTIGKYLSVDSRGSELQIIENYQGKLLLCPQIKWLILFGSACVWPTGMMYWVNFKTAMQGYPSLILNSRRHWFFAPCLCMNLQPYWTK